jgi:hypothetical protein
MPKMQGDLVSPFFWSWNFREIMWLDLRNRKVGSERVRYH